MKKWIDGKIVDMAEDEIVEDEAVKVEIDPITEIQLALAELYEMRVGESNNGQNLRRINKKRVKDY